MTKPSFPDRPTRAAARREADTEARRWEERLWHSIVTQQRLSNNRRPPVRAPRHTTVVPN